MSNLILASAIVVVLVLGFSFLLLKSFISVPAGDYNEGIVSINNNIFNVAIADTMSKREQGLSGRKPLLVNQGMYFVFPISMKYPFWMKDMKFPIDIIWIYGGKIVSVEKQAPPPVDGMSILSLPLYYPASKADTVLEVSSGLYDKLGFKTGDAVSFARVK